jgi:hypothetical protein
VKIEWDIEIIETQKGDPTESLESLGFCEDEAFPTGQVCLPICV